MTMYAVHCQFKDEGEDSWDMSWHKTEAEARSKILEWKVHKGVTNLKITLMAVEWAEKIALHTPAPVWVAERITGD